MIMGGRGPLFVSFLFLAQLLTNHASVPPTFVADAISKLAVCSDGTPAAYYHAHGFGHGEDNWLIYLMGGGWCSDNSSCQYRRNGNLGSSRGIQPMNFTGILSSNKDINPHFYNWNVVYVHYCDGSSFLGDTDVANLGPDLQLRGSRIFEAVIDELLDKGMKTARNALLAGGSAGGLATILHCDGFRARLCTVSRVKCLSDSGFFIRAKNVPYADFREFVFNSTVAFHNLKNLLPTTCTSRIDPGLCLFPEYLVPDIQTPLFILNSAFDEYQIRVNLRPPYNSGEVQGWDNCTANLNVCTPPQKKLINDFKNAFMKTLMEIGDNPLRGLYINACYGHVFLESDSLLNSRRSPAVGNKTIGEAVGDWFFDRSTIKLIDYTTEFPFGCFSSL